MRYQLNYRKANGTCVSNLTKYPNKEDCEYITYTLDKSVEDALILSDGENFNIYGEERISTESEEERLTYIFGLNQSVFSTVSRDLTKEDAEDEMLQVSYDDAGNTVDIKQGFAYNGEKLDESGSIYLRARYYNPRIGQFVQIDSYRGEQGNSATQQRYTYCANNQYKYVDPNGHFVFTALGLLTAGMAAMGIGGLLGSVGYTKKKLDEIEKSKKSKGKKPKPDPKPKDDTTSGNSAKDDGGKDRKTDTGGNGNGKNTTSKKNKSTRSSSKKKEPKVCDWNDILEEKTYQLPLLIQFL